MNKENDPDQELLFKIYQNLIRTEERLKALSESNQKEHSFLKEEIAKLCKLSEDFDKRVEEIEQKKLVLTWTWKAIIFIIGLIPTILIILNALGVI